MEEININPTAFEKIVLEMLSKEFQKYDHCVIEHNKKIRAHDGNYQIDGYIEYDVMGITYKTLLECKHQKDSIKREDIERLYSRIQSCGVHKGILVSSSSFQSGAMEFAKAHGIALIQVSPEENSKPRLVTNMKRRVLHISEGLRAVLLVGDLSEHSTDNRA